MEYGGESVYALHNRVQKGSKKVGISSTTAITYMKQLVDGLLLLNKNGYAHMDAHPHNAVIKDGRAYWIDIGELKERGSERLDYVKMTLMTLGNCVNEDHRTAKLKQIMDKMRNARVISGISFFERLLSATSPSTSSPQPQKGKKLFFPSSSSSSSPRSPTVVRQLF
jgi:serine/threonine protein kinase